MATQNRIGAKMQPCLTPEVVEILDDSFCPTLIKATCKSAHRSRQITMPEPHHSVFYRPDALPAAQPTASKH